MQLEINPLVALLAMVISQSVFIAFLLFFSPTNKTANRVLGILILTISLWLSDNFLRISQVYHQKPNLYFLPLFFSFGFGPLIWFYVRSLTQYNFVWKFKDLIHFIPVLIQFSLYLFLSFCSYKTKYWYWINIHQNYTYRIEFDGTWISMTIYLFLSFQLLLKYQKWANNHYSDTSKILLNWLKIILGLLIILCFQWLVEIILRDGFNLYFNYDYSIDILGIMALILGIAGWYQSSMSGFQFGINEKKNTDSSISDFIPDPFILKSIEEAMSTGKSYLNPSLSLEEFSGILKLNTKIVSRHINSVYKKSFNDFVNAYRIEEVKNRLKSPEIEKMTILGIALDSGFNSKTTFNRIFKEITGKSPSDFMSKP